MDCNTGSAVKRTGARAGGGATTIAGAFALTATWVIGGNGERFSTCDCSTISGFVATAGCDRAGTGGVGAGATGSAAS
jgi:hypothetical protein